MCLPEHLVLLGGGSIHCPRESLLVKGEEVLPIIAQVPEASSAPITQKLTAQSCLESVKAFLLTLLVYNLSHHPPEFLFHLQQIVSLSCTGLISPMALNPASQGLCLPAVSIVFQEELFIYVY